MTPRLFITGGGGFVGHAVVEEAVARGMGVNALVNHRPVNVVGDVRSIKGGLFDEKALAEGLDGCRSVIHLVGIIMEKPGKGITLERIHFEGAKAVVDAAKKAGIRRYIHMSALGTRADAESEYHTTKWKAEEYVRASGLEWTIIRPSMIHGPEGDFVKMEIAWAKKKAPPFLFMPYFGGGVLGTGRKPLLQPVYVKDVARAFVDAESNPKTIGKTYNLAGSEQINWPDMHRAYARAYLGKGRMVAPIPAWWAKMLTSIVPRPLLPFNRSQVIMSQEDNTADTADFIKDFGWTPQGFSEALARYAR